MINLTELKKFLLIADMPHANGTADLRSETDGSRTIVFKDGNWSMNDNFFGGEPYGGRQVIFYYDAPVWLCVYYGRIINVEPKPYIYTFLREALQHPVEERPYRGPDSYEKGSLEYKNTSIGEPDNFSGHEEIYDNDQQIYEATYFGGLIDQRAKGSL